MPTIPESFRRRPGDPVRADDTNDLLRVAESLQLQRGSMRGRQDPGGFSPHLEATVVTTPDHPFRAALGADAQGRPTLSFLTPGHISGVIPVLVTADGSEHSIADTLPDGSAPALPIPDSAFAEHGNTQRALILIRYDLRRADLSLEKAVVIAAPAVPTLRAWTWHRLAGFVIRRTAEDAPTWFPMLFFAQQFTVSNATPATGTFKPWPRIA